MNMPEILQGESGTRLLQGAAIGAIATMIVGFKFLDWSLASTVEKTALDRSQAAVVAALAPICVTRFQAASGAADNLTALNKESSWNRGSFIKKGGWAQFTAHSASESELADSCATLLSPGKA